MLPALLVAALVAALVPAVARRSMARAGEVGAVGLLVATALLAASGGGEVSVAWLPSLGADLTLRLDALAGVFVTIVLVIGAAILQHAGRTLSDDVSGRRTLSLLTAFAGVMLLLVLAGDGILLLVAWEATSVLSFLLISGDGRGAAPARRALLVTAAGGLALLAAVVLASAIVGTTDLAVLVQEADTIAAGPGGHAIGALLLLAVVTKSAQVPVGFWLRGAMVAPTPVSAYLHAAAMVKAGVYLLARLGPVGAALPWWTSVVVGIGLATAIAGGVAALRAHDLKALLAGSTSSQLGFLVAALGMATPVATRAALTHVLAHAGAKAALFLTTGLVEKTAGSRDIRELSGVGRAHPVLAVVGTVGAASLAGLPPLLGFVSKEEILAGAIELGGSGLVALFVLAAAITVGYCVRFVRGAFAGATPAEVKPLPTGSALGPVVCAASVVLAGLGVALLDVPLTNAGLVGGVAAEGHLALWHGFKGPLYASFAAFALGALVVSAPWQRFPVETDGARATDRLVDATVSLGRRLGDPFAVALAGRHVGTVLLAAAALLLLSLRFAEVVGDPAPSSLLEWVVAALLAGTLLTTIALRSRLGVAAMLGAVGFLIALAYVGRGAPDLALTQLLVDALTVVLVVGVFRGMPESFQPATAFRHRVGVTAGLAVGLAAFVLTYVTVGRRPRSPVTEELLAGAPALIGGDNVVNVILVDFRALDTFGEIAVVGVAALGAWRLLAGRGESS
ncbi:MAG: hydrogen gas-evolving membrane-bound hydrogenase subunit E [Actinomycetes bacterium]